jgi:hypothetical protein
MTSFILLREHKNKYLIFYWNYSWENIPAIIHMPEPSPEKDPVQEIIVKMAQAAVQIEKVPVGFVQLMDDIDNFIADLDNFFSQTF